MIALGKTPKNSSEKFLCENTNMIYVDGQYHDFIISPNESVEIDSDEKILHIRVEVLSNYDAGKGPILKFKIRMGKWRKVLGSDFIVTLTDYNIFYGSSYKINRHLEKTLEQRTIELSYRPRIKGIVYTERRVIDLERMKLLKSTLKSEVSKLEESIINDY